jgi:ABC-2 type transport system ATP-binding protein
VTIFLTSHVLEIVERLCTHIGIIHRGELVAQGSLEELRAGVLRPAPPPRPGEEARVTAVGNRSLEQVFLEIVGTDREGNVGARAPEELSWLG